MAVGAGSIARAVKAQEAERKKAEKERKAEAEKGENKEIVKETEKESISIHEEKFKVVSHIKSDLPVYLL